MANPKEWGPLVWKILHICCENLGKNTKSILQVDEINAFKIFLNKTGSVLPCVLCRKHYNKYYLLHNKKDILYKDLKVYAKQYFYDLHEEVNKDNNIVSYIIYDSLETIYAQTTKQELNIIIKEFEQLFQKYILYHFIHVNAVKDFLVSVKQLRVSMMF